MINSILSGYSNLKINQFCSKYMDAPESWQTSFQDPASPIMDGIISFHNDMMFFDTFILFLVTWVLYASLSFVNKDTKSVFPWVKSFSYAKGIFHHTNIEIIWTIIPALILGIIAVPSFALLYSIEELIEPSLSIKVEGNQWFWSYEYSKSKSAILGLTIDQTKMDSYMIPTSDLEQGQLRLLEVDNRLLLPQSTHIQVLVSSTDVLHCWAIPSCGIKIDACPGRLNQTNLFFKRAGVFYGQCSEICGANHGFMPIVVESVPIMKFIERSLVIQLINKIDN